jgi:hypothetical protein
MNNIRLLSVVLFTLLTNTAHADIFSFDGSLSIIDSLCAPVFAYNSYTGRIEYDTVTQTGSASFDPVMFKLALDIHHVSLSQTGGTLHADGFWDWGSKH